MKNNRSGIRFFPGTIFIVLIALEFACSNNNGKVYYISSAGDNANSGLSESRAWRSIDRINGQDFSPGDMILFRGGDEFTGTVLMTPEDSGNEDARVTVSSYGEGKAVIQGGAQEGISADSCQYLTIENLELSGQGRKSGNTTDGLLATNCDGINIDEVEVYGFQKSGIHVLISDDVIITHVYAHENGFSGILVSGITKSDPEKYSNHNLYIGYCVAENNPGDPTVLEGHSGNGILASSVEGGTIEYCEAFNNGWDMPWTGNGPVGIWIWDCTDFTIQYCIAHHNRTNPVASDGGGFDFDGGVSNSIIQYCIAHNNEGAGFGLYESGAAKPWENNTVRYNISYNDGIINAGSVGIWKNDDRGIMHNCQIYNNTFYNSLDSGSNIWVYDNYPGFCFRNNVFVYNGSILSEGNKLGEEVFQGNLYWNLDGKESFLGFANLELWAKETGKEMIGEKYSGYYIDPLFSEAGSMELTDPEKITREALSGFIPGKGSLLIDNGINLRELFEIDPGPVDILGTPVPVGEAFDIGAVEYYK